MGFFKKSKEQQCQEMKVPNIQLLLGKVSVQSASKPAVPSQDDSETEKQTEYHYGLQQGEEFILNEILMSHISLDKT